MGLFWFGLKGMFRGTRAPLASPRRSLPLRIEPLEARLTPSWGSVPAVTIAPPAAFVPVPLNAQGDATGLASITSNETDWYRFTSVMGGSYLFEATTPTSTVDTVIGVYSATGTRLGFNDDISSSNLDSRFTVTLSAGQTFFFGVTNYLGTLGGAYTWRIDGPASTALTDDSYEENDTLAQARDLGTVTAPQTLTGLIMADAHDWYRFQMNGTGSSTNFVAINFQHAQGDLDLELYTASGARIGLSNGATNTERISLNGLAAGSYFLHVYGYLGVFNPSYSLDINPGTPTPPPPPPPPPPTPTDDTFEQNDTLAQASDLGTATAPRTITGLIVADAHDWYRFQMNGTGSSTNFVAINFQHAQGDIDLELYNASGVRIGLSNGTTNTEQISLNGLAAGSYFIHVYGYLGVFNPSYSLDINPGTGTPPPPPPPPPPPTTGGFHIDLVITGMTPSQEAIFRQAAARWEQVITGDLPDAVYAGQVVDDVLIEASGGPIDGPFGILGQAGPDAFRSGSQLPYHGSMEFDSADLAQLEANGSLRDVILHEMGHVLGIGTLWFRGGLLTGAGGTDPRFIGAQATAAYNQIFNRTETGVPVENTGGPGTAYGHWRESVLGNELMTGYIGPGFYIPLSRITVAALADLGYQVNLSAADAYTAPAGAAPAASAGLTGGTGASLVADGSILGQAGPISLSGLHSQLGLGDTLHNLVHSRFSGSPELLGLASQRREQAADSEDTTQRSAGDFQLGGGGTGLARRARALRQRQARSGATDLVASAQNDGIASPDLPFVAPTN